MDFLVLLFCYVSLFGITILCFKHLSLHVASHPFVQIIRRIIPQRIFHSVSDTIDYIFFKRNHLIQVVYCMLIVLGHTVLILDVLPLLYMSQPDKNHITLQLGSLMLNAAAYLYTSITDPGVLRNTGVEKYQSVYRYDGILYRKNVTCGTCKHKKPARSKHCSYCDHCVFRFDHHCVWTNSCIGGGNLRYFLLFLLTVSVICINGSIMIVQALFFYADRTKLDRATYIDEITGTLHPASLPMIIQNLFMQVPRIIILLLVSGSFAVMVTIFMFYHIYLVISNQTTNERYKLMPLSPASRYCPYDRGLLSNLKEFLGSYPSSISPTVNSKLKSK